MIDTTTLSPVPLPVLLVCICGNARARPVSCVRFCFALFYSSRRYLTRLTLLSSLICRFMYFMCAVSCVCILLAFFSLGWNGIYIAGVLFICLLSFAFAIFLMKWIFKKDDSVPEMRQISEYIREGSEGYLATQYEAIAKFAVIVCLGLYCIYMFRQSHSKDISRSTVALLTCLSFAIGAFCSAMAGYSGVWVSVRVNIRVAIAASRFNYGDALLLSFRGGAVSAILSATLCIVGVTVLYLMCHIVFVNMSGLPLDSVPMLLSGYGFGASFVALFMQLGGGIYTKAADVGADMVGKIEKDIPEDDPRNPAVIADLVGDNVGDCAGSMADVFESIAAEIIGTMILAATLTRDANIPNPEPFIFFPLVIHAFDLVVSGLAIVTVRSASDDEDPLASMKRSYGIAMAMAVTGFGIASRCLLHTDIAPDAWWHFMLCGWVGILCSYLLILSTQYYTDYKHQPVKTIAAASQTGHGTNVIAGVGVGMESCAIPILVITTSLFSSYTLGSTSGLPSVQAGVFGTAVATMGMLCTAVFVLSMNNFGPIADNAGGIVEMSGQPHQVRVITDRLDAVGNVTKAASKGYAVGGSALACFVLFQAFLDETSAFIPDSIIFNSVDIAKVEVVIGGMIGICLIFVFTGWAMAAVGNAAQAVVWEVRRQFRENPGIMENTSKPDYNRCVTLVTKAALKEMVKPACLALLTPVVIGFLFRFIGEYTERALLGVEVVAGFLLFASLTGLMMAIFLDNAGGAWDNAKKLIESQNQKGTLAHNAAVTGDTVGDPFKDTAGPALHVIITTMSTTILVLGPLFLESNLSEIVGA